MKTEEGDGHLPTKERGLERKQPSWFLDLKFPASGVVRQWISIVYAHPACGTLFWQPRQTKVPGNTSHNTGESLTTKAALNLLQFPPRIFQRDGLAQNRPSSEPLRIKNKVSWERLWKDSNSLPSSVGCGGMRGSVVKEEKGERNI